MTKIPESFAELCRQKSGTSMVDSGSIYGYQWQRPPIPAAMPREYANPTVWTDKDGKRQIEANIAISTAVALDELFTIDQKATHAFRLWCQITNPPNQMDRSWFELAREYVEKRLARSECGSNAEGLMSVNTYNFDNDLDQVVEITSPGLYADWHILHMHTGADVRGGYAPPVVIAGDLEEFLCNDRVNLYCARCQSGADDLYQADETGWKPLLNKRSVSMVCPKCHHVAVRFPTLEEIKAETLTETAVASR